MLENGLEIIRVKEKKGGRSNWFALCRFQTQRNSSHTRQIYEKWWSLFDYERARGWKNARIAGSTEAEVHPIKRIP